MSIHNAQQIKQLTQQVAELLTLTTDMQKEIENLKKQVESLEVRRGRPPKDKDGRQAAN